jgi:hypothetical protein
MRKLLLASAATLGATAGGAYAQAPAPVPAPAPVINSHPNQGQFSAPWAAGPAANNNNNSVGVAGPGVDANPQPGQVVIRLNGRVEVDMGAAWTSADTRFVPAVGTTPGGTYKVNPVNFASYMRLYPGVDGLTTTGIRYGAAVELRENFPNPNTATAFTAAASASGYSSGETVFVRRAFTYLGTDQVGIVRFGQADGVIGLFDGGVFTTQTWDGGVGNFNGGMMQAWAPQAGVAIPFAWLSQAGAEYGNTKVVYLSPQFYGFDFGVQYAPNMGNSFSNSTGSTPIQAQPCLAAGPGCMSLTTGDDATRWYNQFAVGARYQGDFSGVGLKGMVVYETAARENLKSGIYTTPGTTAALAASSSSFHYDNLNFVNAAAAVQFAGVTVAADYIGGALNGQLAMRPSQGASENAVVTGVTYRNGPLILGAEYGLVNSQGAAQLTKITQRREYEVAFGGTYTLAPGLALVGEYMYTHRHQGNFNFATGTVGADFNNVQAQGVLFATVVTW